MAQFGHCPIGFEDGHIIDYRADEKSLSVSYEFWNERRGLFVFEGFVAVRDNDSVGSTIGSTSETIASELISSVLRHIYEEPPESIGLTHYRFLDVDDFVVFEVVARECSFSFCCDDVETETRPESGEAHREGEAAAGSRVDD
jgi:hypothetical protein